MIGPRVRLADALSCVGKTRLVGAVPQHATVADDWAMLAALWRERKA